MRRFAVVAVVVAGILLAAVALIVFARTPLWPEDPDDPPDDDPRTPY